MEANQVAWTRPSGSQLSLIPSGLGLAARERAQMPRCEVHKTWLAQGAGIGAEGGGGENGDGFPAGSLQAAVGVIVSPSPSVNAEPIEAETQTVPTGPLAKGGVARPCQNHWLCKQQGPLSPGESWWGY